MPGRPQPGPSLRGRGRVRTAIHTLSFSLTEGQREKYQRLLHPSLHATQRFTRSFPEPPPHSALPEPLRGRQEPPSLWGVGNHWGFQSQQPAQGHRAPIRNMYRTSLNSANSPAAIVQDGTSSSRQILKLLVFTYTKAGVGGTQNCGLISYCQSNLAEGNHMRLFHWGMKRVFSQKYGQGRREVTSKELCTYNLPQESTTGINNQA